MHVDPKRPKLEGKSIFVMPISSANMRLIEKKWSNNRRPGAKTSAFRNYVECSPIGVHSSAVEIKEFFYLFSPMRVYEAKWG